MTASESLLNAKHLITECKIKEGATDADEAEAIAGKPPSTRGGKCLHSCIGEAIGIFVNGKLNLEDIIDIAKRLNKDDKTIEDARKVITKCGNLTESDRCEYSAKVFFCTRAAMAEYGIDPSASEQPINYFFA